MRSLALGVALVIAGVASAATTRPTLTLPSLSPLRVVGTHFQRDERVTVTVLYDGRHVRRVRATATGRFIVRFRVSLQECAKYAVSAHGDAGSRAVYRSVIEACGPPPAP